MSPKITYLDIRGGQGSVLDIAKMFPLSEAHPIRHTRTGYCMDDMHRERGTPDLSRRQYLELVRFRTIPTLDLALRELVDPAPWQQKMLGLAPRPHTLDLVPPLDTPYQALDIRKYNAIQSESTYPDLYTRRLPYGLMMRRSTQEARRWTKRHRRGIASVLLTLVVVAVPTIVFVRYSVESGYQKLLSLRSATSVGEVRDIVSSARDDFERANFLFTPLSWMPSETVDLADRAIDGGRLLTRGLTRIVDTLPLGSGSTFSLGRSESVSPEFRPLSRDIFLLESIGIDNPTDWLESNSITIDAALRDIASAGDIYETVHTGSDLSGKMHDVGVLLSRTMKYANFATTHRSELLRFLGHEEPIRYMVFNQNRDEIRANGGFPGSVMALTLYKGNILDLRRDDVYYYDWNLYPYKEIPPPGLALLTDNYGLRDVNYYPDFRITLDKANSFIERSGDSTITSGIAIHQGLVEDILAKTGPISVSGVTIPFDADNFSLLMSTLVENQFAREHHPKDILFQFGDALISKIHEKRLYGAVFDVFERNWRDGEILFASRDKDMDDTIATFRKELPWECSTISNSVGVSSENPSQDILKQCSPNWIYPVFTSVSGNKSDRYITRTYKSTTQRLQGCTYENVVTLSLEHTYQQSDTDKLKSYMDTLGITERAEREKLQFIQGGGKNRAFTRLYVPRSATLGFTGADITVTENDDARVYSFMLEVGPGTKTSKTLRYTVDIPACDTADTTLLWTRQPGIRDLTIESNDR